MGFSIWNLFKAGLLCTNAALILNRQRFLAKYGLDEFQPIGGSTNNQMMQQPQQQGEIPLKNQIVGLLHAVQYLKMPVIALNLLTVLFELILGGA